MKKLICLLHPENAVEEAVRYDDEGADAVALFEAPGEQADYSLIRQVARAADLPLVYSGNIQRFEGAKKILYAGASRTFLCSENDGAVQEARERFGRKILSGVPFVLECEGKTAEQLVREIADSDADELYLSGARKLPLMELKYALAAAGISVNTFADGVPFSSLKPNADGLVPTIVQDYKTGKVLMLAYMNEESYDRTLKTGRMTYYSRSRRQLWLKGETSGHYQYVKKLTADCDSDTILASVRQVGAACHTGAESCFFRQLMSRECDSRNPLAVFEDVYRVIEDRKRNPKEGSYTNYLFDHGIDKILKKVGEEATEIVIAAKNPDPEELKYEIADFLYHAMVLMAERGVTWKDITDELSERE